MSNGRGIDGEIHRSQAQQTAGRTDDRRSSITATTQEATVDGAEQRSQKTNWQMADTIGEKLAIRETRPSLRGGKGAGETSELGWNLAPFPTTSLTTDGYGGRDYLVSGLGPVGWLFGGAHLSSQPSLRSSFIHSQCAVTGDGIRFSGQRRACSTYARDDTGNGLVHKLKRRSLLQHVKRDLGGAHDG